jgi:molybdopterin converting factor small subunit
MTVYQPLKNFRSWALPDHITIKLFSTLRQYTRGGKEFSLPWHTNMQAQEVLNILKIPDKVERVILVNGCYSEPDKELSPDDIIIIFPPVAGG